MWIAILKARLFFPFYKAMFQFLFRYAVSYYSISIPLWQEWNIHRVKTFYSFTVLIPAW